MLTQAASPRGCFWFQVYGSADAGITHTTRPSGPADLRFPEQTGEWRGRPSARLMQRSLYQTAEPAMPVLPGSDRPDTSGHEEPSEDPSLISDWPHVAWSPVLGWGLQTLQKPEEMAAAGTCALAVCPEGAR